MVTNESLEQTVKDLFTATSKPANVEARFELFKSFNHEQFKTIYLPTIERTSLRSPELVLELIASSLTKFQIDLSEYALDIAKIFSKQWQSKDENLHRFSIEGTKTLAAQCSDSSAVEKVLTHYVKVLNGSEGKLAIATQRFAALTAIGLMSNSPIGSDEAHRLAVLAIEHLITSSKTEVNEATLVHFAKQMQLWSLKLKEMPKSIIDWYKSSLTVKTSTSLVKASNTAILSYALKSNMTGQYADLIPTLTTTVVKTTATPITQVPLICESLHSALVLLKLIYFDKTIEQKALKALTALFETNKVTFFNDKFVVSANEDTQLALATVIERLILDHETKLKDKMPLLISLVLLMVSNRSHTVRKQATAVCNKVLENSTDNQIVPKLNTAYFDIFKPNSSILTAICADRGDKPLHQPLLSRSLQTINARPTTDAETILSSLAPTHLPVLYSYSDTIWIRILSHTIGEEKIIPFLKLNIGRIVELTEQCEIANVRMNAVRTFSKYFSDHFLNLFIQRALKIFEKPDLSTTREEMEIYRTPEGELYNQYVIEMHREVVDKNIKRENKLYSHKDQLAERELRKEIEAKKKEKGEKIEEQLNKKQQEAKKAELEKESIIRARIKKAKDQFDEAMDIIYAVMEANPLAVTFEISTILGPLINLFASPLTAERASQLFVALGTQCVFCLEPELKILGETIGYVTLRNLKPACEIPENWTQEPLDKATERVISIIYKRTCRPTGRDDYDEQRAQLAIEQRLTAPAFVYLHPLISHIILHPQATERQLLQCLNIISEHAQMRETLCLSDDDAKINLNSMKNPKYLPRKELSHTLLKLIEKSDITIEQAASDVLLQVVVSGSGHEGCAVATEEEIKAILEALLSDSKVIRRVCLQALAVLSDIIHVALSPQTLAYLMQRIFVEKYDEDEKCAQTATELWHKCTFEPNAELCTNLINDVERMPVSCQIALAGATEEMLKLYPNQREKLITQLIAVYRRNNKALPAVVDVFGRPTGAIAVDTFEPRLCVAIVIQKIASLSLDVNSIKELVEWFVPEALADRNAKVQAQLLEAAICLVDNHGNKNSALFLSNFDSFLVNAPNTSENDDVRRSVVILMGTVARHLPKDDPNVAPIVIKLIANLATPSQIVQEAIANCLPPLVHALVSPQETVDQLLFILLEGDVYGERKGAAYGLAAIVKGFRILALKNFNIMPRLKEAIKDKKNPKRREGALFAFEMLCIMLGKLFEPYITQIVPDLLLCFGDNSVKVRQATDDTAKAVMSKLSAHGVKLILPSLLDGLEEDAWRTKAGSIELLGAMAYCAPKQLSSCLPSIVPKLMLVMSDSHTKVQEAGAMALRQIGSVIRNPEIQAIVPVLLEALQDPANKTQKCLSVMLNTKFVHFIDAPSLALIMPVIQRAFNDRAVETRKMASMILGNMTSLTDQKDLSPYLPSILPGLKQSLIDPVPDVRSVTARALGAMVKGIGTENIFKELMPWLTTTLVSEQSSVDRSGAAQGLSEVIGGLGSQQLDLWIPRFIENADDTKNLPHIRDGYLMMFIYLPMVFTHEFTKYIGMIIQPVLRALADENEYLRDTALKAGQRIVNMYADTAIQILLPELENGLLDDNWRIRLSSVQLLGDLLYKISGVSGKMTTETASEDDNLGTEQSYKAIISKLGAERRNKVLAGLYMGRQDVALAVRQSALHVWKIVVSNTPRTLREILPTLFQTLLGCLASSSYDKQQVAARTLGDLVRKLGERVLPEIIPILEQGLKSDRSDQRQGVCIGLSEIIASTSREMVQSFVDNLVPTISKALYDEDREVRQAAAKCFDSLHVAVGVKALEEILPPLLRQLDDPVNGEHTLDGLTHLIAIKPRAVLPYLIPQLTTYPANTRALSMLSTVAGEALSKHLSKILPAILQALAEKIETAEEKEELEYCKTIVASVTDEIGTRTIVDHLLDAARFDKDKAANKPEKHERERRAAVMLLYAFCNGPRCQPHISQLIRGLILLFTDSNENILKYAWDALASVSKVVDSKEQNEFIMDVRNAVRFASTDLQKTKGTKAGGGAHLLPGFCLWDDARKGIGPILPIFREAVLNGNADMKENAARGLYELIEVTSAEALRPSVVNIAGPLIRVLGDKHSWTVKVAVLETLTLLLDKVGTHLKPFVPQLQQTFLKSLTDPAKQVRLRAASAIAQLVMVHQRVDAIYQELHNQCKLPSSSDDAEVRMTTVYALRICISTAGERMGETVRKSITTTLLTLLSSSDDAIRLYAAGSLGALCRWYSDDELTSIARDHLLDDGLTQDWVIRHGRSVALAVALSETPKRIITDTWKPRIIETLHSYLTSDRIPVVISGVKGVAYFLQYQIRNKQELPSQLVTTFVKLMNHHSNEVKQIVAVSSIFLSRDSLPLSLLKPLVMSLVIGTLEKNSMVKINSELALVSVLRLRTESDTKTLQSVKDALDIGPRETLTECITRLLKKSTTTSDPKDDEFDDTKICV